MSGSKFCPHCKLINRADAMICEHCGTSFETDSDKFNTTRDVEGDTKILHDELEEEKVGREAPAKGIAIFLSDRSDPIETRLENEFFIGRLTEATQEIVVDLTQYNAYSLGVSRRHLIVRRNGKGYVVIDNNSSNGTWVDSERLLPQLPFPLTSGSQIRLGQIRIFLVFPG